MLARFEKDAKLWGAENARPGTASATPAARARNPILEPDVERFNTRRSFAPIISHEGAIFDGHRRGKGTIGEDCAGLMSARRGELLFSDVPPRKAHPTAADDLAGLGSAQALDVPRGKARPMTASSATNRNPLLFASDGEVAPPAHVVAHGVTAHFKGALGPGLLPAELAGGDGARPARRPATARAEDGAAGATSRLLHRHESVDAAHGKAHTPRILAEGIDDVLHYRFAGSNSVNSASPVDSRKDERERYEAELRRLHAERHEQHGGAPSAYFAAGRK